HKDASWLPSVCLRLAASLAASGGMQTEMPAHLLLRRPTTVYDLCRPLTTYANGTTCARPIPGIKPYSTRARDSKSIIVSASRYLFIDRQKSVYRQYKTGYLSGQSKKLTHSGSLPGDRK